MCFTCRPETADSRYRAWKMWLLQKYDDDAEKKEREADPTTVAKRLANERAFKL